MKEPQLQFLNAIITKNNKEFTKLLKENKDLKKLKFGRLSVLSVCYLFNSKKIIKKHKERLIAVSEFFVVPETNEIKQRFRQIGGKSLRLFENVEDVSWEEILVLEKNKNELNKISENEKQNPTRVSNKLINLANLNETYTVNNGEIRYTENYKKSENKKLKIINWVFFSLALIILVLGTSVSVYFSNKVVKLNVVIDGEQSQSIRSYSAIKVSDISFPENCVFSGWFFNNNFSVQVPQNATINSSTKIYAKTSLIGEGTETSPYEIYEAWQWQKIAQNATAKYKIMQDFVVEKEISSIEEFNGVIDGNNKTITFKGTKQNALISKIKNAGVVKNLKIEFTNEISVCEDFGVIAKENNGTIQNISATIKLNVEICADGNFIGGLCSLNSGEITNCSVSLSVCGENTGTDVALGGVCGKNTGRIENCNTSGVVSLKKVDCGGVCGQNEQDAYVVNCKNSTSLSVSCVANEQWIVYVSGVVAFNYGNVTNCLNSGEIYGENLGEQVAFCGGICAFNSNVVSKCANTGSVKSKARYSSYTGGIVALNANYSTACVSECYSSGSLEAKTLDPTSIGYISLVGGIVGRNYGEITKCFSYSSCSVTNGNIGGIVGVQDVVFANITNCTYVALSGITAGVGRSAMVINIESKQNIEELEEWEYYWKNENN